MTFLLTIKRWQLFWLMLGPLFINAFVNLDHNAAIDAICTLVFVLTFLGWYLSMGVFLFPKLPPNAGLNFTRFIWFVIIPAVYLVFVIVFLGGYSIGTDGDSTGGLAVIIVPLHLFCMYCMFWCLVFVAKSLKTVELQRPVTFSDYAGEFFLLWFFPIGIWFIQPRLNKLFADTPAERSV
jgi:hypothetical protein